MDIIFLDNGLIGRGEHSYSLIKQVGEALTRRGVRHLGFGTKAMQASVAEELGVLPHFNYPLYFAVVISEREHDRRRTLFAKILGLKADPTQPSEIDTWRVLNASFEKDLRALPPDAWSADNLIVVPACSQNEILGLVHALLARPEGARPRVLCQLMFGPNWTAWGRPAKLGTKLYRKAFALARPLIGKTLFFTTENEAMRRLYRTTFRIETDILPVPFGDVAPAAAPAERPVFGFFGNSKSDKGFHLLPKTIEICRARGLAADFTVQLQHCGWEPATVAAEAELRRMQGIRLIEGVLNGQDYAAETSRIDAMLLPYDPILFGLRGSGIFTQSAAAGRPVVASKGTFAGDSITRGEAEGEIFSPYDAPALADAVERLAGRLQGSHGRAAALAKAFRQSHSADAYVDVVLAHALRKPE
ncbi:glycosyltransferase [Methylocella tundrae]|uniref:Glycosyl transferase family 1 domain-containing protein n=1 Tax=Methylocella tundrae TaxID=227605 RepID=A0A4U8Z645_METTU|nr:glycosyltransferase [Methylocella tundrae]WPP04599.1 glycosyltransferase [Methylocella tundrae]VFU11026.1 conserved protein of unknown function [Methylocella tundrae]